MKIVRAVYVFAICISLTFSPSGRGIAAEGGLMRPCELGSTAKWIGVAPKFRESLISKEFNALSDPARVKAFVLKGIHIFEAYPMGHGQGICALYWLDSSAQRTKPTDPVFRQGLSTVKFKRYSKNHAAKAVSVNPKASASHIP
jgi:hypothetical protein